jgi:hypothetical protein
MSALRCRARRRSAHNPPHRRRTRSHLRRCLMPPRHRRHRTAGRARVQRLLRRQPISRLRLPGMGRHPKAAIRGQQRRPAAGLPGLRPLPAMPRRPVQRRVLERRPSGPTSKPPMQACPRLHHRPAKLRPGLGRHQTGHRSKAPAPKARTKGRRHGKSLLAAVQARQSRIGPRRRRRRLPRTVGAMRRMQEAVRMRTRPIMARDRPQTRRQRPTPRRTAARIRRIAPQSRPRLTPPPMPTALPPPTV